MAKEESPYLIIFFNLVFEIFIHGYNVLWSYLSPIPPVRRQFAESSHLRNKFHLAGRAKLNPCSQAPKSAPILLLLVFRVCLLTNKECQKGSCRLSKLRLTRKSTARRDVIECVQLLPSPLFPYHSKFWTRVQKGTWLRQKLTDPKTRWPA